MKEMTYAEAIRDALRLEMRRDPKVFLIGEDIGVYGGGFGVTLGLIDEFGAERVIDTPISELGIAGAITGAALVGMRPVGEIMFMDFITLASEQLVNQAAKIRFMFGGEATVPCVMRTPMGSGTGAAEQHSQSLENWFVHVPGIKVVAPTTPYDAKGLLISAIRDDNPVLFVESKLLYKTKGQVPEESYTIPLSAAEVKRPGKDLTIIAVGIEVKRSLDAAEKLAQQGIEAEVIDPRTLKPLDKDTLIQSVIKTGKLLIVHEACKTGGYGGELAAVIAESEAFDYLEAPIMRLAGGYAHPLQPHAGIPHRAASGRHRRAAQSWRVKRCNVAIPVIMPKLEMSQETHPAQVAEKRRRLGGERRAAVERGDRQAHAGGGEPRQRPVGRHVGATRRRGSRYDGDSLSSCPRRGLAGGDCSSAGGKVAGSNILGDYVGPGDYVGLGDCVGPGDCVGGADFASGWRPRRPSHG